MNWCKCTCGRRVQCVGREVHVAGGRGACEKRAVHVPAASSKLAGGQGGALPLSSRRTCPAPSTRARQKRPPSCASRASGASGSGRKTCVTKMGHSVLRYDRGQGRVGGGGVQGAPLALDLDDFAQRACGRQPLGKLLVVVISTPPLPATALKCWHPALFAPAASPTAHPLPVWILSPFAADYSVAVNARATRPADLPGRHLAQTSNWRFRRRPSCS